MGPEIIRQPRLLARRHRGACALLAVLAGASATMPAQAQTLDSETADTAATILTPGSVVKTADMDFGSVAVAATGGTVVMTAASTPTCTASADLVHTGACRAARFSVHGIRNWKVRVRDQVAGTVTLTGPGGATMTMTNFTIRTVGMSPSGGSGGWTLGRYNIDTANGTAEFYIGGTLNVAAAQAPGVYNGTFIVEVRFN